MAVLGFCSAYGSRLSNRQHHLHTTVETSTPPYGGGGGNRTRVQQSSGSASVRISPDHGHVTAGRRKPLVDGSLYHGAGGFSKFFQRSRMSGGYVGQWVLRLESCAGSAGHLLTHRTSAAVGWYPRPRRFTAPQPPGHMVRAPRLAHRTPAPQVIWPKHRGPHTMVQWASETQWVSDAQWVSLGRWVTGAWSTGSRVWGTPFRLRGRDVKLRFSLYCDTFDFHVSPIREQLA